MDFTEGLKDVLQGRDEATMRGAYGVELFAKRLKNDELTLSMRGANGWELVAMIGGVCEYSRVLFSCVAETIAETLQNAAQAPQACEAMPAPAASHTGAQSAVAPPRCAFYKDVRRAYAIAREAGLNVKADEAMRAAFSAFLGRAIESRETMNASDWRGVGDAMKAGYLAW